MVNQHIGNQGWESFGVVRFDLGPLVQGQTRIAKLKSAYNSLEVLDGKPTYRKQTLLLWDLHLHFQGQILAIFFIFWASSHIQKVRSSYVWYIYNTYICPL